MMVAPLVRPGNGLLKWGGSCIFHGPREKVSGYMLGASACLKVVVGDVADELHVEFIAKGANRDVYKGRLKKHPRMGEWVVKAGTTLQEANASLAECKILETGFDGGIAICFYVELAQEHEYAGHKPGERVTVLVEPAVVTGQQHVRALVEEAQAHGGTREVVVSVWDFCVEVGMFAWLRAPNRYMIEFNLQNLYVYAGGVAMLDFENADSRSTKLTRVAGAFTVSYTHLTLPTTPYV